jgi:hypothetical protein
MTLVQDKTEKVIDGFKELIRDKDDEIKKLAAEKDDQVKKLVDEQRQNELKYQQRIKELENENKTLKETSVVKCNSIETNNVYGNGIWKYVPIMPAVAECLPSRIQNFVDLYFFPLNSAGVYRILTEFFRDF